MWMMPTPSQRRIAELRQMALKKGLQVKVVDLPQSHRQQVRKEEKKQGALYRLAFTDKELMRFFNSQYCLTRLDGEAEWVAAKQPPANLPGIFMQQLQQMPEQVVAIELSPQGVACYWREKGGEAVLDAICKQLRAAQQQVVDVCKELI
jgi:hypothetical protein